MPRTPSVPAHGGDADAGQNGAEFRVSQEMLGHAKISTTEMYTRVSIKLLKQVYEATHPGAALKHALAADDAADED